MRIDIKRVLVVTVALALFATALVKAQERTQVPDKYKWNLADIYPSEAAWLQAKADVEKRLPEVAAFKGHLGDSADGLYKGLSTIMDVAKEMARLGSYASMQYDLDTRVSRSQEMAQAADVLGAQVGATLSFLRPEILEIGQAKIESFIAADPRLKPFKPMLDDILRMKAHVLDAEGEKLVAQANGQMAGAPDSIYSIFQNADMPYPEVTLSTGEKIRMTNAAYTKWRATTNREDRDKVFKAFWSKYAEFQRTYGTTLYSLVKTHIFTKDARNYDSCVHAALDQNNVPVAVYKQLISDVHANLPTLHRYLKLRKRMMGVDQLRYEDLYAPILSKVDLKYNADEAMDLTLKAVAPLGPAYVDTLKKGYDSRWVDFYPNPGKKSGAYSSGAVYDLHPFQLLNFNGSYEDVSTLAHESGHSMHSYLSNKTQPYATADYPIFVAEVASTCNENLLFHYMLDHTKDDNVRLILLGNYLDGLRQTLFRQTLFAEFELKFHDMAERGDTLTGDVLTKEYLALLKEYYGDKEGVCKVDDLYGVEWAYIPHFYYNFYVFQYATSITASTYIANQVLEQAAMKPPVTTERDAYIKMLSSGSSKYPIDLLKDVGADMTTSAPFNAAMKEMNKIMDQMEAILDKQDKAKTAAAPVKK